MGSKFVTDRRTISLTPYTGVCGFYLSVKFATSLLAWLAGGLLKTSTQPCVLSQICYIPSCFSGRGIRSKSFFAHTDHPNETKCKKIVISKITFLIKIWAWAAGESILLFCLLLLRPSSHSIWLFRKGACEIWTKAN